MGFCCDSLKGMIAVFCFVFDIEARAQPYSRDVSDQ